MIRYAEHAIESRDRNQKALDSLREMQTAHPDLVSDEYIEFVAGCVSCFTNPSDISAGGMYHGQGINELDVPEFAKAISNIFKRRTAARISEMCERTRVSARKILGNKA